VQSFVDQTDQADLLIRAVLWSGSRQLSDRADARGQHVAVAGRTPLQLKAEILGHSRCWTCACRTDRRQTSAAPITLAAVQQGALTLQKLCASRQCVTPTSRASGGALACIATVSRLYRGVSELQACVRHDAARLAMLRELHANVGRSTKR